MQTMGIEIGEYEGLLRSAGIVKMPETPRGVVASVVEKENAREEVVEDVVREKVMIRLPAMVGAVEMEEEEGNGEVGGVTPPYSMRSLEFDLERRVETDLVIDLMVDVVYRESEEVERLRARGQSWRKVSGGCERSRIISTRDMEVSKSRINRY